MYQKMLLGLPSRSQVARTMISVPADFAERGQRRSPGDGLICRETVRGLFGRLTLSSVGPNDDRGSEPAREPEKAPGDFSHPAQLSRARKTVQHHRDEKLGPL